MMPKQLFPSILFTTLVAGTLDILLAFLHSYVKNGVTPDRLLRFIASGLFGRNAFTGSSDMIVTGLLLHFIIVLIFTVIFFYLYRRIKLIASNKIISGIIYSLIVWCVMSLIVLPLSKTPPVPIKLESIVSGVIILVIAIGLPIVYFAHKFYSSKRTLYAAT